MIDFLHSSLQTLAAEDLMTHVQAHPIFVLHLGGMAVEITNHTIMVFVTALLMVLIFAAMGAKAKDPVPTGLRNFFEAILSFLRTDVARPALGANTDRFIPFIWTVFFFILFCNLLGLLPIGAALGLINPHWEHLGGTATGNLAVTACLAVCAFIVIHLSGIIQHVRVEMDPSLDPHHTGTDHLPPHGHGGKYGGVGIEDERDVVIDHFVGDGHDHAHGVHHAPAGKPFALAVPAGIGMYIWNFAPHPELGVKALDILMWVFLLALEIFGALVKPFSLCVRLFANMMAGHLVLAALISLVPFAAGASMAAILGISIPVVLGSTVMSVLELFVAFLQAYIFTFLMTLFIASAVAPEH